MNNLACLLCEKPVKQELTKPCKYCGHPFQVEVYKMPDGRLKVKTFVVGKEKHEKIR